jgi:hypothetical protein
MKYKYQIIFLGKTTSNLVGLICEKLESKFYDLFPPVEKEQGYSASFDEIVEIIFSEDFRDKYEQKNPTFCYYIGSIGNEGTDDAFVKELIENGKAILPIYINDFLKEIPESLHPINARMSDPEAIDYYVDIAFQELRMLRKRRRIFISYKRSDSTGAAIQLFEELCRNNFDPFLDTYSIAPAVSFQNELYHRMSDSDVLVQLLTENFYKSKYCTEDIEKSNSKGIGVVQVIWPECSVDGSANLCVPFKLNDGDMENKTGLKENRVLSSSRLKELVQTIESCRARNLASVQNSLRTEFLKEANGSNRRISQETYYLVAIVRYFFRFYALSKTP